MLYVYVKQLEEADTLAINKVDSLEPSRVAALSRRWPTIPAGGNLKVSARTGDSLEAWFDDVLSTGVGRRRPGNRLGRVRGRRSAPGVVELHRARFGASFDGDLWLFILVTGLARLRTRDSRSPTQDTLSPDGEGTILTS